MFYLFFVDSRCIPNLMTVSAPEKRKKIFRPIEVGINKGHARLLMYQTSNFSASAPVCFPVWQEQ